MDVAAAQRLVAAPDPRSMRGLMQRSNDPAVSKAVAQQFGSLFMQSLLQQSDGSGIAMTGGVGNGVVNNMFASTMGRVAMSGEKVGLTDLMLRSIEAKQRAAGEASPAPPVAATSTPASEPAATAPANAPAATASNTTPPTSGLPLTAYWQGDGMRPLGGGHMRIPAAVAPNGARPVVQASLPSSFPITMPSQGTGSTQDGAATPARRYAAPISLVDGLATPSRGTASPQAALFAQQLAPFLKQAGAQLGVSPRILLAQAALETGWGQSVVGNNIFGIKAGASWTGDTVTTGTHEYEDGKYVSINAAFRAYPSLEAAVRDFVTVLGNSQRYRAALGSGDDVEAYGRALIGGGWATDIDYVRKLQSVASGPSATAAFAPALPSAPAVVATR